MRRALIVIALLVAASCKQQASAPQSSAAQTPSQQQQLTPEQLGEIGAEIHRHPADAQKILAGRNITPEAFEKAVRDVAQSPDSSRRYRDAYRKSG